jgi:hypothetical protein
VLLRQRPAAAAANQQPQEPPVVKDLGTFDGVARDLRESPYFFDLDLGDVPDGPYLLAVEVMNQGERIGTAPLSVALRKGVDELAARLEADAKRAPDSVRADILSPSDRLKSATTGSTPHMKSCRTGCTCRRRTTGRRRSR